MFLYRTLTYLTIISCCIYLYFIFQVNVLSIENLLSWKTGLKHNKTNVAANSTKKFNQSLTGVAKNSSFNIFSAMPAAKTTKIKKSKEFLMKWLKFLPKNRLKDTYKPFFDNFKINLCPNKSIQLIMVIISSPESMANRICVRKTWGFYKIKSQLKIVFLIGKSKSQKINYAVYKENKQFKDIIEIDLQENYYGLTYKTVAMLELVSKHCKDAKFLMKLDDDTYLNLPRILRFLANHKNDKRKIYGTLGYEKKPVRDETDKYFVRKDEYSGDVYPDYISGGSYLITSDIISELYITSLNTPYLKYEDVFLTGIVAHQLDIDLVNNDEFNNDPDIEQELINFDYQFSFNTDYPCTNFFYVWWKQFNYYRKYGSLE